MNQTRIVSIAAGLAIGIGLGVALNNILLGIGRSPEPNQPSTA